MAHFIATIDPSIERRTQFTHKAHHILESCYGSPAQSFEHGKLALVSWIHPWRPLRYERSTEGLRLIWGQAMEQRQPVTQQAPDLDTLWRMLPTRVPPPLEGLHIALLHRSDGSWTVGADILGLMPVYYHCSADHVIVGSSPELFRAHPAFRSELDPAGLAGILLINGLVDGRSIHKGVRRLEAGRLLHAQPGEAPRELKQYFPEMSDKYFGASFEENYARLEQTLDDCLTRHIDPHKPHGLILSGGLDSRLMAGFQKERNLRFTAFSFGSKNDIEMQCAKAVAKALELEHRMIAVRMQQYTQYAEKECRWNHLANGFSTLMFHEPIPEPAQLNGGMLSGFAMDHIIGASGTGWGGNGESRMSFANYFRQANRWGMPAPAVKALLVKSYDAGIVDEVLQTLQQTYIDYGGREFQNVWAMASYHRVRYHTSSVLGLGANWPWPVVPYLDTQMLDLIMGMPYAHIRDRRLQYHMIKQRFPKLARLPLDRNSFDVKPVMSPYGRVVNHLLYKPRELFYRCTNNLRERRFYYRAMDFNSAGWNAVRLAAEPYRQKAAQILDETALAGVLPPPAERVVIRDGIIDSSKMKLMAGFMLWLAENP